MGGRGNEPLWMGHTEVVKGNGGRDNREPITGAGRIQELCVIRENHAHDFIRSSYYLDREAFLGGRLTRRRAPS